MKFLALFALFVVAAASRRAPFDPQLDEHWENFKKAFGKSYNGHREEIARRFIFEQNVAKIVHHNLRADVGIHSFKRGLNEFADMSHEEFVKTFNGYKRPAYFKSNASAWVEPYYVELPENVDWREQGFVTPVKNQGQCGSCWAFSATGALEGQHKKKTGNLVSLSEQQLVDCSTVEGNNGCEGGLMDNAFQYIKDQGGIDTEESYPYTAKDGRCHFNKATIGATCTGFTDIPSGDEDALMQAVAVAGPVSVAIDASHESFQTYASGVYDEPACSSENLDHGVLIVGYGTEDGRDYWLVKNSWGKTWGLKGYLKMSRNRGNQCGIATQASFPMV